LRTRCTRMHLSTRRARSKSNVRARQYACTACKRRARATHFARQTPIKLQVTRRKWRVIHRRTSALADAEIAMRSHRIFSRGARKHARSRPRLITMHDACTRRLHSSNVGTRFSARRETCLRIETGTPIRIGHNRADRACVAAMATRTAPTPRPERGTLGSEPRRDAHASDSAEHTCKRPTTARHTRHPWERMRRRIISSARHTPLRHTPHACTSQTTRGTRGKRMPLVVAAPSGFEPPLPP